MMGFVKYGHREARGRKPNGSRSYTSDDAVFTKRVSFEHEKELRLVVYSHDLGKPISRRQEGLPVPVNVSSLITEVVVSPAAPRWMKNVVKRVVKQFGFSLAVRQSSLNELRFSTEGNAEHKNALMGDLNQRTRLLSDIRRHA